MFQCAKIFIFTKCLFTIDNGQLYSPTYWITHLLALPKKAKAKQMWNKFVPHVISTCTTFSLFSSKRSSPGVGGGALRCRGGPHPRYVFRGKRGLFLRPPHVRDFVKEGFFFVPTYEVWGSKSPYNTRNIRGSDAEWLPKWLGSRVCCRHLLPLNTQRIIKSKVKIRVPVHPMSVFW